MFQKIFCLSFLSYIKRYTFFLFNSLVSTKQYSTLILMYKRSSVVKNKYHLTIYKLDYIKIYYKLILVFKKYINYYNKIVFIKIII